MTKKLPQIKPDQIKKLFEQETGIPSSEILEISDSFPAAFEVCVQTIDRTFWGRLDSNAKLKPNTLKEDK